MMHPSAPSKLASCLPLVVLGAVLGGCPSAGSGTPAGFTGAGDSWSFPLVGPLEDGLLVTPVTLNGHGPYLFALDPDASRSAIDGDVVRSAELVATKGPPIIDEAGIAQPAVYADVTGIELGSLVIERRDMIVVKPGAFTLSGRLIQGVLGRDVLAESFVFGFDRDEGLGYLISPKSFKVPAGAIAVQFEPVLSRDANKALAARKVAKAVIGGETFAMHLDLGATASQLREPLWERAKLAARELKSGIIDELGTFHRVTKASEPVEVTLGTARNEHVAVIPFEDKRWDDTAVEGSLGLGFFSPYNVWVNGDAHTYYLAKRNDVKAAKRFTRWDSGPLEKCKSAGCLTIRVIDPLAGKPLEEGKVHPGVVLSITRDESAGGMGLEVVLEAKDRPTLPRLLVNLSPNTDRLIDHLDAAFLGATLLVVDASPYPRVCPGASGCVDRLER